MNPRRLSAGMVCVLFFGGGIENRAYAQDLAPILIQRVKAATVLVDAGENGTGTAFLVNKCGLFATARHVVEEVGLGGAVKLVFKPGETGQKVLAGRVAVISEDEDLALLKTEDPVAAEPLAL